MLKAKEAREQAEGRSLLEQLQELGRETRAVLDSARSFAEVPREGRCAECVAGPTVALKAIARLERQLELHGRLIGELEGGASPAGFDAAAWIPVRDAIARALEPFPEARQAVADALAEFEPAS